MRRPAVLAAAGAAALVLAGCGTASVSGADGPSSRSNTGSPSGTTSTMPASPTSGAGAQVLDGRTFTGRTAIGGDVAPGAVVRLRFDGGELSVEAGCNKMSGAYTFVGGHLSVRSMGATAMACPPGLQAQDAYVRRLLTNGPRAALTGSTLTIGSGAASMTLRQESPRGLLGTTWAVRETSAGSVTTPLPAGVRASVTFNPDGRGGSADEGCNSGSFTLSPRAKAGSSRGTFVIRPGMTTMMACPLAARMSVEGAVRAVLTGTVDYRITGNQLTLMHRASGSRGAQGLTLTAAQALPPGTSHPGGASAQ